MRRLPRALAVVLIAFWTLFPFYSLVVTSITSSGGIGDLFPGRVTFEYYGEVLLGAGGGSQWIWPFMKNSTVVCSLATAAVILFCLPCAYGFSRWRGRAGHRLYLGYFILRMLPPVAMLVPWYFILNSVGLIDTYRGLSFIYFLFQLPVGIWLMKGFFDTAPMELEESAWIEGASVFQTFRMIIVPLVSGGVAVTAVFVFIYCYIEFMYASIFTRNAAVTLPPYIAGYSTPWEIRFQLMLAAALVSILPMMALFFAAQRYMVKGITGGALKY
jgi:multiple sugar transport system permease protein